MLMFLTPVAERFYAYSFSNTHPLYNGALLNFPPERHNFWSGSGQFTKVQQLTMWQGFRDNLEISERPCVDSFDFEKFGRSAGKNGKTANSFSSFTWCRQENKRIDEEAARAIHSVGWDHVKFWCTLILTNICNRRHASPTAGSNPRKNFVSITTAGEQATDGQQWRGVRQPRATACCRVQLRDTVCSHACACWIMLSTFIPFLFLR